MFLKPVREVLSETYMYCVVNLWESRHIQKLKTSIQVTEGTLQEEGSVNLLLPYNNSGSCSASCRPWKSSLQSKLYRGSSLESVLFG